MRQVAAEHDVAVVPGVGQSGVFLHVNVNVNVNNVNVKHTNTHASTHELTYHIPLTAYHLLLLTADKLTAYSYLPPTVAQLHCLGR